MTVVAASAIGIEPSRMIPVASALELLHGASLIHDDIVDEAAELTGREFLYHLPC
jgi:geranylgeranyl pyrophosphate synthase